VHAGLEPVDGLCDLDHLAGQLGVAAAGAPREVNELGTEAMHAVHAVVEILHTLDNVSIPVSEHREATNLCRLGREEFEREGRLPLGPCRLKLL
jgi:hypothetical protein